MNITLDYIEIYLSKVKEAIAENRYRIEKSTEEDIKIFLDYVLSEEKAKEICLGLTPTDFSEIVSTGDASGETELMYVFGKDIPLLERFGIQKKTVSLHIKFNKMQNDYTVIVSFREQKDPICYYFK